MTHFIPALLDAEGVVRTVATADSELAWDLARANVLAIIPEAWNGAVAGSVVDCIVLDDTRAAPTGR
ncbi:MAG: hypothetical protein IPL36_02045 [Nigerium sp.]|nr:hypothetical protein [Nigerium sp.]